MREPTDDEVERAMATLKDGFNVRVALRAAMNPPPEPEIVVTDDMSAAGWYAYASRTQDKRDGEWLANLYRAMRRLEPKKPFPILVCRKCGSQHVDPERRGYPTAEWALGVFVKCKRKDAPRP